MIKAGANRVFRRAKGMIPAASSPSYTGPLDLVPGAVAAYGQRAMSAAMVGQPIYTLRRSSDDAEVAYSSDASGNAPVADITAWIGGGSGYVSQWNDQTGNGADLVPPNAGAQPQWLSSGPNSKPYIGDATGESTFDANAAVSFVSGYSVFDLIQIHTAFQTTFTSFSAGNAYLASTLLGTRQVQSEIYSSNGADFFDETTQGAVAALDAFVLLETHVTADAISVYANGSLLSLTDNGGNNIFSGADAVWLNMSNANLGAKVRRVETLIYDALTAPDISTLRQNIATYYGITL